MDRTAIGSLVAGAVAMAVTAFVVMIFVVKWLWAWTIPDLCPGAVEQGLVAGAISWGTAVKVALFVAVLSLFAGRTQRR